MEFTPTDFLSRKEQWVWAMTANCVWIVYDGNRHGKGRPRCVVLTEAEAKAEAGPHGDYYGVPAYGHLAALANRDGAAAKLVDPERYK
jgi:hypothetical protein